MIGLIAAAAACLALEAFFSGSEMAMVSANRLALESRAAEGHSGSALAVRLLKREDQLISTCLIGTNLTTITGTTLTAVMVRQLGLPDGLVLSYVPLTVLFGEALPKTVFQHHATTLAPRIAPILRVAQIAFMPLLAVASGWASILRRLAGAESVPLTRQDIVDLLEEEDAAIDPEDQEMIRRVFRLNQVTVEDAMTPLVEVDAIPDTATLDDAVTVALAGGHSRLPVYRERVDNIVGLVDMYDLLYEGIAEGPVGARLTPVRFVPETKRADELLHEMRQKRDHFAVVVDEYGGSVGVVTIEDLLEEIIGEIRDERDEDEPRVRRVADNTWRIPARTEIDEVEEALGVDLPEGDYDTIAGLMLAHLGRIPAKGEQLEVAGLVLKVEEASDRAVLSVTATLRAPPAPTRA